MIKHALLYRNALPNLFSNASLNLENKFYTENFWTYEGNIGNDDWSCHQFVSVDTCDNIVGYFSTTIDRSCYFAHSFAAIRFTKDSKYNIMFAKDFKKIFVLLFDHYKYNKLDFSICIGSPYESMYDRFIEKYGGRIVGIKFKNYKLIDGTICDQKFYELERESFIKKLKRGKNE